MRGRTVLITGASSGLGYEAALKLARLGANVVLVVRDARRGEAALATVRGVAGPASVSVLLCDMASLAGVRALAKDVEARHDRLDVLVNNAGSVKRTRETTPDGLEWTFAAGVDKRFSFSCVSDSVRWARRSRAPPSFVFGERLCHFQSESGRVGVCDVRRHGNDDPAVATRQQ
jgi:NAD(P)-dependent dehydrogenase (short-subunit alcohol dehydrogenase family)